MIVRLGNNIVACRKNMKHQLCNSCRSRRTFGLVLSVRHQSRLGFDSSHCHMVPCVDGQSKMPPSTSWHDRQQKAHVTCTQSSRRVVHDMWHAKPTKIGMKRTSTSDQLTGGEVLWRVPRTSAKQHPQITAYVFRVLSGLVHSATIKVDSGSILAAATCFPAI